MAAKGAREHITLECTECHNRTSAKNTQHTKKQNN